MVNAKRQKLSILDPLVWHSASNIHNYILNDPILDFLKIVGYVPDEMEMKAFNYLCGQGHAFEKKTIEKIRQQSVISGGYVNYGKKQPGYEGCFVQVAYSQEDILKVEKFNETVKYIKLRVPIIYQGVLHDSRTKTYGCPDIIIRGDYLLELFLSNLQFVNIVLTDYYIIDIKFTTLKFKSDGFLSSEGRMKANKAQILIYNRLLSSVTDKISSHCFVYGRNTSLSKMMHQYLGIIVVDDEDELSLRVDKGLEWLTKLKKNYKEWLNYVNPFKLDIKQFDKLDDMELRSKEAELPIPIELYPNMCNTYDAPYHEIKLRIAEQMEEITLVTGISYKTRCHSHELDIYKWSDPLLPSLFEPQNKPTINSKIITSILDINRPNNKQIISPAKIKNNFMNWTESRRSEFFIDFETTNNLDAEGTGGIGGTESNGNGYVFMIGLLYSNKWNENSYYNFSGRRECEEFKLFDDMHKTIVKICEVDKIRMEDTNFYHWGHIENYTYNNVLKKYNKGFDLGWNDIKFCNFLNVFKTEPIAIKGLFNYSLKSTFRAIQNITTPSNMREERKEGENRISNGFNAMILAAEAINNNNLTEADKIFEDIRMYNKMDCEMVQTVVNFCRKYT